MLELSYRSEIWQASRQQRCRDACQISEWYDNSNIQSRFFETSRDLAVRRLTAKWIEAHNDMGLSIIRPSPTTTQHNKAWTMIVENVCGSRLYDRLETGKRRAVHIETSKNR